MSRFFAPARRGFSLSELLVILAAVSILTALLFPVFGRARDNAQKQNCASNLRQIGAAWLHYSRDYDGKTLRFSTTRPGQIVYWWGSFDGKNLDPEAGLLRPYLTSVQVLTCPSFQNATRKVVGATGYAYNNWYLSPVSYGPAPGYAETDKVVALSQIQSPAQTVVMADSARLDIGGAAPVLESNTYLSPPRYAFPALHGRHKSRANVLWADGHVKAAKPIYRTGNFGYEGDGPYNANDFRRVHLGDLDRDGDLTTNELFDLK